MAEADLMKMMWSDMIKDRRNARTHAYVRYVLLAVVALVFGGLIYGGASLVATVPPQNYVAVVRVTGPIAADKSASAGALRPALERAFKDTSAKGVVLLINSPGGTPVQASLIHDYVLELKKAYNKPVVAVGEDLLTSGAYLVAVAADSIVVNRSTITGSIGVVSRGFGAVGLLEKLGVERRVLTAGDSKSRMDTFAPLTDADKTAQLGLLAAIHGHFKDDVQEGRGPRLDMDTPDLFSGMVWTGDVAVKQGLADKLGSLETVVLDMGAKESRDYTPSGSWAESVLSAVGVTLMQELSPRVSAQLMLSE